MAKILLVEDDDNLRGIYGDRLTAEGYEIVAARDGEEALAMAVNEKPDLIISDIMMPKISGFDMLDILRSTKETKHTKVIMMTALSQKEDQDRGKALGADRYLIKSQVTLEDVVRVAGEVLAEGNTTEPPQTTPTDATPAPAAPAPTAAPTTASPPATAAAPQTPDSTPAADTAAKDAAASTASEKQEVAKQIDDYAEAKAEQVATQPAATDNSGQSTIESASVGTRKVISPIDQNINQKPDINELLKKEMAVPGKPQPAEEPPTKQTPPQTPTDTPDSKDVTL